VAHGYLDDTSTVIKVLGTPTAEILDQMRQLAGSGVSVRSARPFGLQPFRGLVNSPRRVIGGIGGPLIATFTMRGRAWSSIRSRHPATAA
jgi:hypothetical protein